MLILTRRVGETVVIGNDVDVTVLGVKGNQVRLGVKAPREVSVHREEIYKRIKDEKADEQAAAQSQATAEAKAEPKPTARVRNGAANGANGHGNRASVHAGGASHHHRHQPLDNR